MTSLMQLLFGVQIKWTIEDIEKSAKRPRCMPIIEHKHLPYTQKDYNVYVLKH